MGGHCLVNWPTVSRPKDLGGLGVLDLDKFSRALRLRWLWQEWTNDEKPWAGLQVPCNKEDNLLFQAFTRVTLGNGMKAKFWHHSWLDGEATRNLAPHLFELVKRKNRTVAQELSNNAWIRTLKNKVTTTTQIEEFVSLWIRLQHTHLRENIADSITWKWTPDGIYSTSSAYRAQFLGAYRRHKNKLLTADNLAHRGWPHQTPCSLCHGPLETGLHLCLQCPFALAVWNQILSWEGWALPQQANPSNFNSINEWWVSMASLIKKDRRRDFNGIAICTMWNIWKEHDRSIFEQSSRSAMQ
ncbi:hypothetical protein U9M48_038683, partial [Paspalum notatum var. saurae]